MGNVITITVLAIIIAAAVISLVRSKKLGSKCIGCPSSEMCSLAYKERKSCENHRKKTK